MPGLVRNRWLLLVAGYLLVAIVATVTSIAASGGFGEAVIVSDRVSTTSGTNPGALESFPTTAQLAQSKGWNLATWCILGQGRFFRRGEGDVADPLMLVYSDDDRLVGINLHSATEQPSPPWEYFPDGMKTGFKGREGALWAMSIYVSTPLKACDLEYRGGEMYGGRFLK